MSQGRSASYIGSSVAGLVRAVLEGFSFHPYFYLLEISKDVDPPLRPYLHQVDLLARLALRRPVRVLIGDEIGLGKTIEAISIARFLEEQGEVKRVLLLVPRILVEQWRGELERLGLHSKVRRVERDTFGNLDWGPGWYIASMDLVKRKEYVERIVKEDWDLVIVDEAHRVGRTGGSDTLRYRLVSRLAGDVNRNLLLLTATPHRGNARDYIERLRLVDPHLLGDKKLDSESFYLATRYSIVFRRSKMDVNELEGVEVFKRCRFIASAVGASEDEKRFNRELYEFLRDKLIKYYSLARKGPKALPLLLTLVAKRASSSPFAAVKTFTKIIEKRAQHLAQAPVDEKELDRQAKLLADSLLGEGYEEYEEGRDPDEVYEEFFENSSALLSDEDIAKIRRLFELARKIQESGDSRLGLLLKELDERGEKRVVVFTEFRDTAEYIYGQLKEKYGEEGLALITSDKMLCSGKAVQSIEDVKKMLKKGEIRVIVSTDVASEGLNLQTASVIIHYEPVWSPVKLMQRVGRVWRLGQEEEVESVNLITTTPSDVAVLSKLYTKLMALVVSGIETTHAYTGEELTVTNLKTGERAVITLWEGGKGESLPPVIYTKRKAAFSEYQALIRYIAGGEKELEKYVNEIVAAMHSLRRALERAGLRQREELEGVKKALSEVIGGDSRRLYTSLVSLLTVLAEAGGCKVGGKADGRLFIYCHGELYDVDTHEIASVYANLSSMAERFSGPRSDQPVFLLAEQWESLSSLLIYRLDFKLDSRTVFSEAVGLARHADSSERLLSGAELLKALSAVIPRVRSVYHEVSAEIQAQSAAEGLEYRRFDVTVKRLLEKYSKYLSVTEERGVASRRAWGPRGATEFRIDKKLLGVVLFVPEGEPSGASLGPSPEEVRRVEERAMSIVMEYERRSGREPLDVHETEHYDIYSVDRRTGEERFIEVKGHSGSSLRVELTESEFRFLESKGEKAWLYLVLNVDSPAPLIVMVRDPARSWSWSPRVKAYVSYGGLDEAPAG